MSDPAIDLSNCELEPIHQLGAIQPIGFLLAVTSDWLVARASANVDAFLDSSADSIIGLPLTDIFGAEAVHDMRNRAVLLQGPDAIERIFDIALLSRQPQRLFDCALHLSGDSIVIEAEPRTAGDQTDAASLIRSAMARLDAAPDLKSYFRVGARQLRAMTGFDRVMVYRFAHDGSGEVVGEAAVEGIGSFLGLHYPASDIPAQARQLYLRTPFRIIPDIGAAPVPIVPARDETGAPLDLSLSVLRSVSRIHIEYLRNMGVGASLSVSIVVEGRLWGLFACHHYSPRCPSFERRTIAELFGQMFALKLESRDRRETAHYETGAREATDRLLAAIASDVELLNNPVWVGDALRAIIPCDGVGIVVGGKVSRGGVAPSAEEISAVARRLNAMAAGRIFATDHLATTVPGADRYAQVAAGLLSLPLSRTPRDYVLLFRQEQVRSVTWAGDPHKPASYGPNGMRLTPRESFAAWSQEVRGRSEPFSDAELRVAETLRASLIEVVLRLSDAAQADRRRAAERQELLIAELNHRVRNILALIRGLVRQSRGPRSRSADYIDLLEGRIEALARAHDQITQDNWGPARLRPLIETEVAAYLSAKQDRVKITGEAVLIEPSAYSSLALVIHELMTNAAKYGGLSDSGGVNIEWQFDPDDNLMLDWREFGGPAVKPPTRQGFGTTIIQRSVPYDLGGSAQVDYKISGIEVHFVIPARHVRRADGPASYAPAQAVAAGARPEPQGPSLGTVLLVEDSLLITMDAEDLLMRIGAATVVTAANVAQAIAEIERQVPDIAVLDFNLGHETSLPVADRLLALGVRYVFATGYGNSLQLPAIHAGAPVIQKPYAVAALARVLRP